MWILPSYKRPDQCRAVLEACVRSGMVTPGVLIINGPAEGYDFDLPEGWTRHHEPENIGFAAALNKGVALAPDAPWFGVLSDDCYPETDGWDRALVDAASDRYIAHCDDHWHSDLGRAAGIVVLGGALVRALGFLTVPDTWHSYCDDLWEAIWADFNNRRYLKAVTCRNPHPMKGDAPADETYKTAYGPGMATMHKDGEVYRTWMNSKAKRKAWNRIRALFPAEEGKVRKLVYGDDNATVAPIINEEPGKIDYKAVTLMIATPAVDEVTKLCYTQSMFNDYALMLNTGMQMTVRFVTKCSMIDHARNLHCSEFLKSECTHLMFIDDDMGWPQGAMLRLLSHNKPIMAAVGCTREFVKRRFCAKVHPDTIGYDQKRGLVRVTSVGTGFMLIQRHVIEKMAKAEFDAGRGYKASGDEEIIHAPIFEFQMIDGVKHGEDYTFCNKWRKMGGEVWVDPTITLVHAGSHDFVGSYQRWLEENGAFRDSA